MKGLELKKSATPLRSPTGPQWYITKVPVALYQQAQAAIK
jgi:hypothetical protein